MKELQPIKLPKHWRIQGILFHYFSDKRTLYLTVVDECLKHYYHSLTSSPMDLSEDLFQAIEQLSQKDGCI